MPLGRRMLWCKCLTGKGLFALIVGFPNALAKQRPSQQSGSRRLQRAHTNPKQPISMPNLIGWHVGLFHLRIFCHEAHLPAFQSSPRPHARLFGPHEDPWRPRRHRRAARQGPQALVAGLSQAPAGLRQDLGLEIGFGPAMVGRMLRAVDFERVMARPPLSRSAHFAVHHLAAGPAAPAGGGSKVKDPKLSTGDAPTCPPLVDDSLPTGWWLGTVVPKRHARRSVTRNLIKRQMRVVMGELATHLLTGLWVLRLKSPFDRQRFTSPASDALRQAARDELCGLLQRAAAAAAAPGSGLAPAVATAVARPGRAGR